MVTPSFVGLALVGTSTLGLIRNIGKRERDMKRLLTEVFELAKIEIPKSEEITLRPEILRVKRTKYGFDITIRLPKGYTVEKFRSKLEIIEEATVSKIQVKHLRGREVLLQMGMFPLKPKMDFTLSLVQSGKLTVPYFTHFGTKWIDFWDETTCHIIVAGATRMGKSVFLRLLFTQLILATDGKIHFYYVNNKKSDWNPFRGIPQVPEPATSVSDARRVLEEVMDEIQKRIALLDEAGDAVNISQYRRLHPEKDVPPLFLVIDEYGRFAEDDSFQETIQEIAETAGYLDVHLVIATQRPDATTVLKPRIRANILTRICFQTADEKNSEIVVHTGQAAHLDNIRGRAVILDGVPELGQIPYISEEGAAELLSQYRSGDRHVKQERQEDSKPADTLPGFVTRPVGSNGLSRGSKAVGDDQPRYEAALQRRVHHHNSKTKR